MSRIPQALVIGVGGSLVLGLVALAIAIGAVPVDVPTPILAAVPTTPLLYPGWKMQQEEKKVRDRDSEFPSFIRALGAVESVKQASTGSVLESLRRKDFGSLTENVDALYKRLNMRIDELRSWRLFAAETGSYLIQKFGDMYVMGRRMGGDPRSLGQVISANQTQVLKLREKRQQATTTLIGVLYGITASMVFAFFIGLEIVEIMVEITAGMDGGGAQAAGADFLSAADYDLQLIEYLLIGTIYINAAISSAIIRFTDRGHLISGLVHFVSLVWVSSVIAVITQYVVSLVISV